MDQGVKRNRYDYTVDFKRRVVEQVERGDLTYRQAQQHHGVQGAATVLVWLRQYGRCDWSKASSRLQVGRTPMTKKSVLLTPEQQRIKQLEKQLKEATEKASLFEAVVHVMKRDYGITVKKPLGKSLRKSSSKD